MKRLLVIDDVAVIRGFVKAALKELKVNVVEASGGKIAQVAREMRLHDSSVGNWVREAREAKAGQAPTAAERAEIRELKAELERVTRERDILGKAVAYFSASHPKNV